MRYNNSSKFQYEDYSSIEELLNDAVKTIDHEINNDKCVHILTDKETTEYLLCEISKEIIEDKHYDIQYVDITDENDLFITSLFEDGEVYIDKAIANNNQCVQLDGILFADKSVDKQFYCDTYQDVIVFDF